MNNAFNAVYNFIDSDSGIEGCRNWQVIANRYADYLSVTVIPENLNWGLCLPLSEDISPDSIESAIDIIAENANIKGKLGRELPVLRAILRTRKIGGTFSAEQIGYMWDIPVWKARYAAEQI